MPPSASDAHFPRAVSDAGSGLGGANCRACFRFWGTAIGDQVIGTSMNGENAKTKMNLPHLPDTFIIY